MSWMEQEAARRARIYQEALEAPIGAEPAPAKRRPAIPRGAVGGTLLSAGELQRIGERERAEREYWQRDLDERLRRQAEALQTPETSAPPAEAVPLGLTRLIARRRT